MDEARVVDQRLQVREQGRLAAGERQAEQGQLPALVAAVVVADQDDPFAGQIPAPAGAGQRGQRLPGPVRGQLGELHRAALIGAGQDPAGLVDVVRPVYRGGEKLREIHTHAGTLSHRPAGAAEGAWPAGASG